MAYCRSFLRNVLLLNTWLTSGHNYILACGPFSRRVCAAVNSTAKIRQQEDLRISEPERAFSTFTQICRQFKDRLSSPPHCKPARPQPLRGLVYDVFETQGFLSVSRFTSCSFCFCFVTSNPSEDLSQKSEQPLAYSRRMQRDLCILRQ